MEGNDRQQANKDNITRPTNLENTTPSANVVRTVEPQTSMFASAERLSNQSWSETRGFEASCQQDQSQWKNCSIQGTRTQCYGVRFTVLDECTCHLLDSIQRRALKIIGTNEQEARLTLNIPSLQHRRQVAAAAVLYKMHTKTCPAGLKTILPTKPYTLRRTTKTSLLCHPTHLHNRYLEQVQPEFRSGTTPRNGCG
ncbi:hypothetical protein Bbelb_391470 [Branchiostoma belcheri]|nr:hypothetical protein Bbelb_391470 [Branchiostoma belcheri]